MHPYEKSFNHAILETAKSTLEATGQEYSVIDLYEDKFNPVYEPEELALFHKGEYLDPIVKEYQEKLTASKKVVFIFPIWWGEAPAMLKGFFDKVMLPGFGYHTAHDGHLMPGLNIPETYIITTSEAPSEIFEPYFNGYFIPMSLTTIGMNGAKWMNLPHITVNTLEERKAFLEKVAEILGGK